MAKRLKCIVAIVFMLLIVACADTNGADDTNQTNDENNANETNNENENEESNENEANDEKDINENNNSNDHGDSDYDPIEREEVADVFLKGEFDRVYNQTSADFQAEVTAEQLQEIGETFNEGVEGYVFQSELALNDGMTQYTWVDETETKGMIAVFDEDDTIGGFRVLSLETYPETDERLTETEFQLPFENEWFVFWGGTNELVNYHYAVEEQRYAFDFLIMQDGNSYEGDPEENESYYAFGENMLAPADGVVIAVENDIEDNEPVGEMNSDEPLGNHVIIEHADGEYSFLAHLKHGSVGVKEGDDVKANDIIGLVGNSGNSSEPHIHFHVADAPDINNSTSIRINLGDKELIQGDVVTP